MNFEVADGTIIQVLRMRATQDPRVKDLLESMSWEAVAMEQQAKLQGLEQAMGAEVSQIVPEVVQVDEPFDDEPES